MNAKKLSRRWFIQRSLTLAAGGPLALQLARRQLLAAAAPEASRRAVSKVALVRCQTYGAEVRSALQKCFDLLGGIGPLVKDKTVTVKLNLTGSNFGSFLGRPVGETYMTHEATVMALASSLFAAGARRVRLVESTANRAELEATLLQGRWDVRALSALGRVEFENTRNLGKSKRYAHLAVPGGGGMFSAFELNQAYEATDVMVSLAKLKNHSCAGVTLSMKNLFGITPVSLYGNAAGSEDATDFRGVMHDPSGFEKIRLPGVKPGVLPTDAGWRVPRITADLCAARPIHLAIIDGITSMSGGEGPWCGRERLKVTTPGVLLAGFNPVSTDGVGTAVMGYANPRGARGTKPFLPGDNHLVLAEHAGLGTADLAQIDVRGLSVEAARYAYG